MSLTNAISLAIIAFFLGFWFRTVMQQNAVRRKAEREEQDRIRQLDDETTRVALIEWAFGDSKCKNVPPVPPAMNREEVVARLRDREAAVKLLEALLDNPKDAGQEYERFIRWFNLTGGEPEIRNWLPHYLLWVWADRHHPHRGTDDMKLLTHNFKLTEQQAHAAIDRYYELLP
jgi:hypothetical protein